MNLRFAPNLSMLWAGLALADRFERAAQARPTPAPAGPRARQFT